MADHATYAATRRGGPHIPSTQCTVVYCTVSDIDVSLVRVQPLQHSLGFICEMGAWHVSVGDISPVRFDSQSTLSDVPV